MKLSRHSILRMNERTDLSKRNYKDFFRNALKYGKSAGQLKDGKIKEFLLKKEKNNCRVKLYKDYVFVHSRNSKQLYTMYKLPDELLEERDE